MAAAGTAAGSAGPEPMPSYAQLVQRGWGSALAAARGCADCGWGLARRGLAEHAHLAPPELLLLALCALGWTALRSAATSRLFRVSAAGGWDVGGPGLGGRDVRESGAGTQGRRAPLYVSADQGDWNVASLRLEELGTRNLGRPRAPLGQGGVGLRVDVGVWPGWGKPGTWGP